MSRRNDTVEGVFTKLYNSYRDVSTRKTPAVGKVTRDWEEAYDRELSDLEPRIRVQALREQLIMQRRVLENIKDIKLGFQDEYIFAMCPFYRGDKKANDVRVYPGKISIFGRDVESLYDNEEFMDRTISMLRQQMVKYIEQTEDLLREII
jgi:hypothetical protein